MPRSAAQAAASRRNGARSRGPVTAAGKARSRLNARTHGLRAADPTPLGADDRARLDRIEGALMADLRLATPAERVAGRRIALARWRVRVAQELETRFWNDGAARTRPGDPCRLLRIVRTAPPGRGLDTILRYQAEADRALARARRDLAALRAATSPDRTDEPEPARRTDEPEPGPATAPIRPNEPEHRPNGPEPRRATPPPAAPASPPRATTGPEPVRPQPNRRQRRRQAALARQPARLAS